MEPVVHIKVNVKQAFTGLLLLNALFHPAAPQAVVEPRVRADGLPVNLRVAPVGGAGCTEVTVVLEVRDNGARVVGVAHALCGDPRRD